MKVKLCGACKRYLEKVHGNTGKNPEKVATLLFHGKYIDDNWCEYYQCLNKFIENLAKIEEETDGE